MSRRIMDVTTSTTLDYVRGQAHGLDWVDHAAAAADVDTTDDAPPAVTLEVELDPTELEHLDGHADMLRLSPTEARTLATALLDAADAAEPGETTDVGARDQADAPEPDGGEPR